MEARVKFPTPGHLGNVKFPPLGDFVLLATCLSSQIPDPGAALNCQNPDPGESWLSQIPVGFSSRCFLKEIENIYTVFLSSYRNILWETSKKLWKHSPAARVPTEYLVLPNFHSSFYNSIETRYMFFYFLNNKF